MKMLTRTKLLNFIAITFLVFCFQSEAKENNKLWLQQGQSELKKIAQGDNHSYHLKLDKGQFIAGVVIQNNVDVEIAVYNPSGTKIGLFDRFFHGKEPFHFTTKDHGIYQLQVNPIAKDEGLYSIGIIYTDSIATTREDKMQQMMAHYAADEPGGVVAVVQAGKMIFSQGYGLANVEYDIANETTTPFHMASGSKPFTAFAIAMLAEQNKLSLDDDVRKHLSWMPDFGEVITLRHLLNHSSGLKDAWNLWEMSGGNYADILTQQQILEFIKIQRELNFKPGQRFQYNNGAYALLAEVVSMVTKQNFSHWMTENIFKPLAMNSTYILDNHQSIIKQRAYSYESKYLGLKNAISNKSFVGAVNVYSTANDLSHWLRNYHTLDIGNQNILNNMWQPSRFNNGKSKNYALGVFIKQHRGLKQILQGGTTAGFRTMLNYYPKIDAAVIVLANTPDFNVSQIARLSAEIFFADAMQLEKDIPIQVQVPGAHVKKHVITSTAEIAFKQQKLKSLNDYVGIYYSEELSTTYKFALENKLLVVKYHRGIFPLNPKGEDSFGLNDDWLFDWDFTFVRDEQGRVQQLRLDHSRAQNVWFKRLGK
jgi:CubicO group peptidase (beta-lactamase class C family)